MKSPQVRTEGRPAPLAARFARARVLLFPAVALLVDLGLRLKTRGNSNPVNWSAQDAAVYALGVVWSVGAWLILGELLHRLGERSPRARTVLVWILSVAGSLAVMLSFAYRAHFDQSPSWQVVKWSIAEWKSVLMIARWVVGVPHVAAIVLSLALMVVSLGRQTEPLRMPGRWPGRIALVAVAMAWMVNTVMTMTVAGFQDPLPVDSNAAAAFTQLAISQIVHGRHLVTPVRPGIRAQPERPRPNVLLLIHESLRADAQLPDLGYLSSMKPREIAPFGSSLPDRRAEGFFLFPKARTNSTATESSVPTILSGVDPGGDTDAYGRSTSYWSLGKAVRAQTFLFSAQSYSFSHFDEFFFDDTVDIQKTGEDLSKVLVNDRGIDDAIAVDAAVAHLRKITSEGKPFVGVIHFNGTHSPGWPGPDVKLEHKERDNLLQYSLAAKYIDKQVARVFQALAELGLDDRTVVLSTSDHGEAIVPHHPVDRLGSFYEECTRIPIWVRVPPRLLREHPEWETALDHWHDRNVQNLDILPTVRDLLGMSGEPALAPPALPGRSLVQEPPPGDDIILGQSTCAFRAWALDGFYIVNGSIKFIASNDQATPQIYDLQADRFEEHNLWNEPGWKERVMPWVEKGVRAGKERMEACKRIGAVCPVKL